MQLVSLLQWWTQSRSLQWASQSVSLLQWHCQCNDLSSHHSTHQWIDSSTHSYATSESATMTLRQCNDLSSHHSTHQWIWSYIHMQLVSLLQWHLSSMQWFIYSHRSIYQWIDSSTRSCANSESATMTSFVNAMTHLLTSLYLSVNRSVDSFACN